MVTTLVVDDSKEWYELISRILEPEEYQLTHAENIKTAQSFLENSLFRLLILDAFMPDMDDWWKFYSLIKTDPRMVNMGIVITFPRITPDFSGESKEQYKFLVENSDYFVIKPFTAQELITAVSEVLKRSG